MSAVELESHLRRLAKRAALDAMVPVRVVDGTTETLPADTGSFDVAVISLVLCSVPDQRRALGELHRVLRTHQETALWYVPAAMTPQAPSMYQLPASD